MAEAERPEKYNWWLNELDSLGISTLQKNGLAPVNGIWKQVINSTGLLKLLKV
jgi:hypothetical protein